MLQKEEVVNLVNLDRLLKSTDDINGLLARYGVKFGIYKNGTFKEQLFPFDPIPEEDRRYVLDHFDTLVIKDAAEAGGYGIVFGNKLSVEEKERLRAMILSQPRR